MARRFDLLQLRKPERTSQGFLRADVTMTRSGVFTYSNPDGSMRKEYRPPDEVFRADSLKTFEDAPVTLGHPDKFVTAANAKELSVGLVKEIPRRDGDFATARVLVTDAAAISRIEGGKTAVSLGYECDYDPTPGVTPSGERFDGSQKNIRGNHLALVESGRAGPEARIRLDSEDAILVHDEKSTASMPKEERNMEFKVIKVDGIECQVATQSAQIIERELQRQTHDAETFRSEIATLKADRDKQQARADGAESELKKRTDAANPEAMTKLVNERVQLIAVGYAVLGEKRCDELKLDGMGNIDIKRAVVLHISPEAKQQLEGKSEDYVSARYDQAVDQLDETPQMGGVRIAAATARTDGTGEFDINQVRADAAKKTGEAWKPLAAKA